MVGFSTDDPLFISVLINNSCSCYSCVYRTVEQCLVSYYGTVFASLGSE